MANVILAFKLEIEHLYLVSARAVVPHALQFLVLPNGEFVSRKMAVNCKHMSSMLKAEMRA